MVAFNERNTHKTKQHRITANLLMKNLISGFQMANKKTKQKKKKNRKKEEIKSVLKKTRKVKISVL
jgi:pantothenate synthetase